MSDLKNRPQPDPTAYPPTVPASIAALHDSELRQLMPAIIGGARRSICTMQFQISPMVATTSAAYRQFMAPLLAAPSRGVQCRAMLARATPRSPQAAANAAAGDALRAAGWQVRYAPGSRLLHAKAWAIDDRVAVIGSHNITEAALSNNRELSVLAVSEAFASTLRARFDAVWIGSFSTNIRDAA